MEVGTRYCRCAPNFEPSPNPNNFGCVKCGRLEDPGVRAHHPVVREHFETLNEVIRASGTIPDERDWETFVYSCLERIEKGAQEYGAANFKKPHVDLVKEACEETYDLCVYPLLEIVKNRPADSDAAPLGEAARHAYLCYQSLRRYEDKVRGAAG